MNIQRFATSFIRILLGVIFISSAVMKLFSLDNFILYVYSFGIFGYLSTTILARILIVFEFLIGVGLMFRIFYRFSWWGALLLLSGFSLFLIYVVAFRGNENCHCFGDVIDLNAIPSIIKNIVMIALLATIKKQDEFSHKSRPYIITIAIAGILFVAFIGFPPNALFNKLYGDSDERFSQTAFNTYITDSLFTEIIDTTQNEIIGFVSAGCTHCRNGNTIMRAIFEQNQLDHKQFKNLVMSPNDSLIEEFKDTTHTQDFFYKRFPSKWLIDINYGHFPTYVFFEKGHFKKAINYKEINENEVVEFLQK